MNDFSDGEKVAGEWTFERDDNSTTDERRSEENVRRMRVDFDS